MDKFSANTLGLHTLAYRGVMGQELFRGLL